MLLCVDRVYIGARTAISTNSLLLRYYVNLLVRTHFNSTCLDAEREEKDLEREAPSVTERSCVTTSRESPSPPFDDLLDEVVLRGSVD